MIVIIIAIFVRFISDKMISFEQIKALQQRVETLGKCIDIDSKRADVAERTEKTLAADFWDEPKEAEKFLKELSGVKFWVTGFDKVATTVEDLNVLLDFARESMEGSEDEQTDAEAESCVPKDIGDKLDAIARDIKELEEYGFVYHCIGR
mgnify:CR=1 FL=1